MTDRTTQETTDEGTTDEGTTDEGTTDEGTLTDVRFVGEKTAAVLRSAGVGPADIEGKRVSYRDLVDAGVNPGVAARVRREHSLSWSFTTDGDDLDQRSVQVRGLGDEERAWVAASSGDWTAGTEPRSTADTATDGSGDPVDAESAWRERSAPDPVSAVPGIDDRTADRLADGGITSVRSLATADVSHAADALGMDEATLASLREAARLASD